MGRKLPLPASGSDPHSAILSLTTARNGFRYEVGRWPAASEGEIMLMLTFFHGRTRGRSLFNAHDNRAVRRAAT